MPNLLFTSEDSKKILSKEKTITLDNTIIPTLSSTVIASTRYDIDKIFSKERNADDPLWESFAELQITGACIWNPSTDSSKDLEERLGYSLGEIVEKSGYRTWQELVDTYSTLNEQEKDRFFVIEFTLIKNLLESHQLEIDFKDE